MKTLLDAAVFSPAPSAPPALIFVATDAADIVISRAEFGTAVRHHAAALHQLGLAAGDVVIIAHTQNLESIYAFWGAIWLGAIPAMFPTPTEKLDPTAYLASLRQLVHLSAVRGVITTDEFAAVCRGELPCEVWGSRELQITNDELRMTRDEGQNKPNPQSAIPNPQSIAFLQHSSGTTGLQKGVALSHAAVWRQIEQYAKAIALNTADVIVSWLPLYHDMGLIAGFLLPLLWGVPLVLMSPFDWVSHPALLLRAIDAHQGTLCWLPNFAYHHCARRIRQRDTAELSLASMRAFINCSEPVRHESHQLFLERFGALGLTAAQLAVSYAMAENTFAVTQTRVGQPAKVDAIDGIALAAEQVARPCSADDPQARLVVSCGAPLRGTAVRVLSAAGQNLPERHIGELAIQSDMMLTGYYNRPDLDPWQEGWFRTGDMGYIADGEIYIVGRAKDLIINAGKNIYPQDIEAIVNEVAGVYPGRVVAFGVPDEREGTELVAVVAELTAEGQANPTAMQRAIRQAVAQQAQVTASYVHLVDERWLIKTSSGKLGRAANRAKWEGERRGD